MKCNERNSCMGGTQIGLYIAMDAIRQKEFM